MDFEKDPHFLIYCWWSDLIGEDAPLNRTLNLLGGVSGDAQDVLERKMVEQFDLAIEKFKDRFDK